MHICNRILIPILAGSNSQQSSGSTDPAKAMVVNVNTPKRLPANHRTASGTKIACPRLSSQCLTISAVIENANKISLQSPSNLISIRIFASHLQGYQTKPPKPCTIFTSQHVRNQQYPTSRISNFPDPVHSCRFQPQTGRRCRYHPTRGVRRSQDQHSTNNGAKIQHLAWSAQSQQLQNARKSSYIRDHTCHGASTQYTQMTMYYHTHQSAECHGAL